MQKLRFKLSFEVRQLFSGLGLRDPQPPPIHAHTIPIDSVDVDRYVVGV